MAGVEKDLFTAHSLGTLKERCCNPRPQRCTSSPNNAGEVGRGVKTREGAGMSEVATLLSTQGSLANVSTLQAVGSG